MRQAAATTLRLHNRASFLRTPTWLTSGLQQRQISTPVSGMTVRPRAAASGRSAANTAGARTAMLARHMSASDSSRASTSASGSASPSPSTTDDVVRAGSNLGLRTLTLNRPKALNSLNKQMISLIKPLLEGWEVSKTCSIVLVKGEGRAFCAGGDVVSIVKAAQDPKTQQEAVDFFKDEYECDRFIAHMKKPIVTFMDGITMGGGVGLSVHAPFRIATEKTVLAMPETKIGLFPDVGANFFLPRLDGRLGTYLALTSENIHGYGVYQAGIASHFVNSDRLSALEERLAGLQFPEDAPSHSQKGLQIINNCIEEFVADADAAKASNYDLVGRKRRAIDNIFAAKTAEEIIDGLKAVENGKSPYVKRSDGSADSELQEWARKTRETIEERSPTSVKVTLEALRLGSELTIDQVFDLDMRLANVFCDPQRAPDFVTGVTHVLIEKVKGKRAAWSPSTLHDVSREHVRKTFLSEDNGGKTLPKPSSEWQSYKTYPHANFALPTEQLVSRVVKGNVKDSGSFAMTADEVQQWFQSEWNGKIGVREKVDEILSRKTETAKDGTVRWRESKN